MDDHRTAPRHRVLRAETIEFGGGAINCMVRNLSNAGAALDVSSPVGIPEHFTLVLESVRRLQAGLHSFLSMRRIEARRKNASAVRLRFSQSLASLRQRLSQAMVRSTTQRLGKTTNPLT
jgi:hypothetical protein